MGRKVNERLGRFSANRRRLQTILTCPRRCAEPPEVTLETNVQAGLDGIILSYKLTQRVND